MMELALIGNLGNDPELNDGSVLIPLTREKVAIVDACDVYLGQFKWYAAKLVTKTYTRWYAARAVGPKGKQKTVYMHRVILGVSDGVKVDHRDRDGLNNRHSNLRLATVSQNNTNSFRPTNRSGFRGVVRMGKKWRAQIRQDGRRVYLGFFGVPEDAARAYDAAAIKAHGEFATLNFVTGV